MFMSSSRGGFGKPLAAAFRCEKDVGMQVAIPQVPLPADLPYRLYHGWRARDVGLPTGHVVDVRGNGLMDEAFAKRGGFSRRRRSEEHTSELQSLMRISYAVFCLKKKKNTETT